MRAFLNLCDQQSNTGRSRSDLSVMNVLHNVAEDEAFVCLSVCVCVILDYWHAQSCIHVIVPLPSAWDSKVNSV